LLPRSLTPAEPVAWIAGVRFATRMERQTPAERIKIADWTRSMA